MFTTSTTVVPLPKSERVSVLVVDDDPAYRKLVSAVLQSRYTVTVADDGVTGLDAVRVQRPQLTIVDVQMPGMDGLQLLAAIRSEPALSQIKIIMLTADASRETVLAAVRGGADDYLIKTAFSKDELIRKIERLLQSNVEVPPAILRSTSEMPGVPVATPSPNAATTDMKGPHTPLLATQSPPETSVPTKVTPRPGGLETSDPAPKGGVQDKTHLQEILDSWD